MKITIAILLAAITCSALPALAHPDHDSLPGLKGLRMHPTPPAETVYGRPGDASQSARIVNLDLNDKMRFTPAEISVKQGETIKFVVKNTTKGSQVMVLGTLNVLKERAKMLKQFPKMEMSPSNQVQVKPGESAELLRQFTQAGTFDFACGAAVCLETGAIGKIVVNAK